MLGGASDGSPAEEAGRGDETPAPEPDEQANDSDSWPSNRFVVLVAAACFFVACLILSIMTQLQ